MLAVDDDEVEAAPAEHGGKRRIGDAERGTDENLAGAEAGSETGRLAHRRIVYALRGSKGVCRMETTLDSPVLREQNPMLDEANRLKLAVFCVNVARGTSISFAESLPKASWAESVRLAQAADRAGIDGFIPLGRWKNNNRGRPEDDRFLEPFTWAAGLGALTERISLFADGAHGPLPPDHRRRHVLDHRPHLRRALFRQRRARASTSRSSRCSGSSSSSTTSATSTPTNGSRS